MPLFGGTLKCGGFFLWLISEKYMKYNKESLTFEKQADLLLDRGMIADRDLLICRLKEVNYYRLSAYWYPFREKHRNNFIPETNIDKVWQYYTFDRQFRLIVMDAIERVEISVRTHLTNTFTLNYGPFGHIYPGNLPNITVEEHQRFLKNIHEEEEKSKEAFLVHFRQKYSSETELPLWIACELMSFGTILTLYKHLDKHMQSILAVEYQIPSRVLESWLTTLNYIRNICAHHARLWNRELAIRPFIPRYHTMPVWHFPVRVLDAQSRIFSVLTVLKYLLSLIAPQSRWQYRMEELFNRYPDVPLKEMGFPENWKECPIWKM
jgi:abortive infection bacteriophage resistance protein